jgi:peptidoglycan hydrolase-like protein with peptidoglycan-binding domain
MTDLSQLSDAEILAAAKAAPDVSTLSDEELLAAIPQEQQPSTSWNLPSLAQIKAEAPRQLGLMARMPLDAVAALPLAALSGGAAVGNLMRQGAHALWPKNVGTLSAGEAGDNQFDPMRLYQQGMAGLGFPTPNTPLESVNNALGSALAGGAMPMRPMTNVADQVPSNFVSPADKQRVVLAEALRKGQDAGLVTPPAMSNPTVGNVVLNTISGKGAQGQAASTINAPTIQGLAAEHVGLNPDAPLTQTAIRAVRHEAVASYRALSGAGDIGVDHTWGQLLDQLKGEFETGSFNARTESPIISEIKSLDVDHFDTGHAINVIEDLRASSRAAFNSDNGRLGYAYRQLANGLENQISRGLELKSTLGVPGSVTPQAVTAFKQARQLIARTHTIEDAMSGNDQVSMPKLIRAFNNDEPIGGKLGEAVQYAAQFPKAVQAPESFGSAGINHLTDIGIPAVAALSPHPAVMAAGAAFPFGRYAATAYQLSAKGQEAAMPSILKGAGGHPLAATALAQALAGLHRNIFSQPEQPTE